MRVIFCEQGEPARAVEICNELEEMQSIVGGLIEIVPVIDGIAMVCNEEGKLRDDLKPNRFVWLNERNEVIYGNFFFCGADGKELIDVPEHFEAILLALFEKPNFDKDRNRIY